MARKKSLDDGPVLRGQILECASRLFYERGFGATSIRDIAEAVGISSSTMYHHFTNKQDVLHAIVFRFMTDFVEATVPTLSDRSLSPTERIRRTVRLHIEISDDRRPELLVGNPIRYALTPAQKEQGVKLQTVYHDAVRDTIKDGAQAGEFTVENLAITTMAVLDMLNGIREWFSPNGPLTRDEVIDHYVDLVLTILAARPGTSSGSAI
ncbi:TetR/AcrR family transcriptional regulator [Streptomyces sp. NPDC057746]|uniref:TetR/AcrR family transcriptional regulator n=1 Tax=Streptomyces sp. NPDC057746 TaxID=3346237 RepID=UPI0036D02638